MTNAIPAPVQSLLDLFSTSLANVCFADIDGPTLARHAVDVETAAEAVAVAQIALDTACRALQEKHEALLQQAQRALAYARVYAESDETMRVRLEAISLPRAARRSREESVLVLSAAPQPSPRPRGRPRKTSVAVAEPTLAMIAPPGE